MKLTYLITPAIAWVIAGSLKFAINSLKARRLAFKLIGYGGLPSNHSAIVSSMATLIAMNEGLESPAFGVAITLALIVVVDAHALRREIGKHAIRINQYLSTGSPLMLAPLRERMGHSAIEIAAGIAVGVGIGVCMHQLT